MKIPFTHIIALSFLLLNAVSLAHSTMTVSGPITASSVTVTGDVTISSVTASSMTVLNLLNITGAATGISGSLILMQSSVTFQSISTTATSYMAVPLSTSAALSKAGNYLRVSVSGILNVSDASTGNAYLTVMRDSTDLGDTIHNTGLAIAGSNETLVVPVYVPVGINIVDSPGDTTSHVYQPYIKTSTTSVTAGFTNISGSALLIEEISP